MNLKTRNPIPPRPGKLPPAEALLEMVKALTYTQIAERYGVKVEAVIFKLSRYRVKHGLARKPARSMLNRLPPAAVLRQWQSEGVAPAEIRRRCEQWGK